MGGPPFDTPEIDRGQSARRSANSALRVHSSIIHKRLQLLEPTSEPASKITPGALEHLRELFLAGRSGERRPNVLARAPAGRYAGHGVCVFDAHQRASSRNPTRCSGAASPAASRRLASTESRKGAAIAERRESAMLAFGDRGRVEVEAMYRREPERHVGWSIPCRG